MIKYSQQPTLGASLSDPKPVTTPAIGETESSALPLDPDGSDQTTD